MKQPPEVAKIALIGVGSAVVFGGSTILREVAAVSDWPLAGPVEGISYCITYLLGFLCMGFVFGCIFLFVPNKRGLGLRLIVAFLGGWVGTVSAGVFKEGILHRGAERLVLRSRPLIEAIRKYEATHTGPPEYLEKLVPDFLSKVPTTGMSVCPQFRYEALDKTNSAYGLNPWYLRVNCDRGSKNYDVFLFLPNGRYEDVRADAGLSGSWERVEDWAYMHQSND